MRDLPTGPSLLSLARNMLLNDLMPLLPEDSRLDARLVANSMAIAEREAVVGEGSAQKILRELKAFYGDAALTRPALQAGSPERSETREGEQEFLCHFAHDLRVGAFEGSETRERDAREILWRLTIAKLRQANPRFLAANGLS